MPRLKARLIGKCLAVALLACAVHQGPQAAAGQGPVTVTQAWARVTIPGRPVAVYATIANLGAQDDRLRSASTPAAARAELHTHVADGDILRMRKVKAIEVPAGATIALQPGGHHIMLFDLSAPLAVGETFPLTLTLERAGAIEIAVTVRPIGHGAQHGGHGGGDRRSD